jgi:hypothetical protein
MPLVQRPSSSYWPNRERRRATSLLSTRRCRTHLRPPNCQSATLSRSPEASPLMPVGADATRRQQGYNPSRAQLGLIRVARPLRAGIEQVYAWFLANAARCDSDCGHPREPTQIDAEMVHMAASCVCGFAVAARGPTVRVFALWVLVGAFAHQSAAQAPCAASDHGMLADGSDNVPALTRTLAECAGRTIHIAHGTYNLSPKGFATGIHVPAGTTLVGDGSQGPQQTVLQIASSGNFASLLWIRNVSNVAIHGIRFEGAVYESGCTRNLDYGHAIYIQSDSGQKASVDSVDISGDAFHNFNGQSWVTINAADGSPGIGLNGPIAVKNNVFDSNANLSGGCAASRGMGYSAVMVSLHGSNNSNQGLVEHVEVDSNTFNAGYVKGAIAIWSGARAISVAHNTILDTGARLPRTTGPELGRYAILVYNSAHELPGLHPDTVRIVGNTITNPVSCGIYVAGARNLEIAGNRIAGQSDRYDVTLPKGAISLNHSENVSLQDNELTDNYIGIASVGSQIKMGTNRINAPIGGKRTRIVP